MRTEMLAICREESRRFPSDIEAAVKSAEKRLRKEDGFDEFVGELVRLAIQEAVYDARHRDSVAIRSYGGPARVIPANSEAVRDAYRESLFNMPVGGTVLGRVLGEELLGFAAVEREEASGHTQRAMLLEHLRRSVPDGKSVQQAVTLTKLRKIWKGIQNTTSAAAGA